MTTILITGVSGTGKSTVCGILKDRGYQVAETDDPGWCVPADADSPGSDSDWIWNEDRITRLLDTHSDRHLFIDGCRSNQGSFYHRFDQVVVFNCPLEIMLERIAFRTPDPFGKTPEEQAKIAGHKAEVEPLLIRGADIVIDTSTSTPIEIADRLEALL